jgi:hypothetical protein
VNEFAKRNLFDGLELFRELLVEDLPGFGVSKTAHHVLIVYRYPINNQGETGHGQKAQATSRGCQQLHYRSIIGPMDRFHMVGDLNQRVTRAYR